MLKLSSLSINKNRITCEIGGLLGTIVNQLWLANKTKLNFEYVQ
jgi:hypothetical protein